MGRSIKLNVSTPCHEDWNKMTPASQGRFCDSCQKQVIDFTSMSDAQLAAFFRNPIQSLSKDGSVCGRFMTDQLDRSIEIPKKRIPWVKYFFQFALPAFLASSKAAAQGQVRILTGDTVIATSPGPWIKDKKEDVCSEKQIRGKVIDANGEGMPYASVYIKGTTIGTASDSIGNFTLKFPGSEENISLMVSSVGYETVEMAIDPYTINKVITLKMANVSSLDEVVLVGAITVRGRAVGGATSVVKTTTFMDTLWNKIFPSNNTLQVFPNPVKKSSLLTVKINGKDEGAYSVEVTGVSGQRVLHREISINNNDRIIQLAIPSIPAGTYLLNLRNKKSGKIRTEKIIVE